MDAKAKVGNPGWVPALKAQTRLMAELQAKFEAGESVQLTPEQFAVMETYMEEDEALSTDLGMLNLRQHEQLTTLLTGLEALAGEWERIGCLGHPIADDYRGGQLFAYRSCALELQGQLQRTLTPAAANPESEE